MPPKGEKLLSFEGCLDSSNEIYQELLGYQPEQTSLQFIPKQNWEVLCQTRGINPSRLGFFLPRNQTAVIQGKNHLTLFHEYFGHGMYCEQSLMGKRLVDLEKKLLKEEEKEFQGKNFTLNEINLFRQKNELFKELNNFIKRNNPQYESFAIWTEYFLSKKLGLRENFEKKYKFLSEQNKKTVEGIFNFSEQYGDLATFYNFGLSRQTNPKRARTLLKEIYGGNLKNIQFALLYGSRNPFKDIDIFAVSEGLSEIDSSWLDVRVYSNSELEKGITMLDVSITDPLLTGEIIFGDKKYFELCKRKLLNQPITEQAIKYNFDRSEEQKRLVSSLPKDECDKILRGLDYSNTFGLNALSLKKGERLLTKKSLLSSPHSEKFIDLKGGKVEYAN
jgi:hypothetical protein